jgi:hypothetical protein
MLADQRRLIAPGEAVDDARFLGASREQRTGERVRLHVHHHDVLAVVDGFQAVRDARARDAGRLHDHLDLGRREQAFRVVDDDGSAALARVADGGGGVLRRRPARRLELIPRARDVEVRDRHDVQAFGEARLREKHGAELASADQPDGHRAAGRLSLEQQRMQVQGDPPGRASSSTKANDPVVANLAILRNG